MQARLGRGLPQKVWSLAALDAIDKSNCLPIKRLNGKWEAPNKESGRDKNPPKFLPYGKQGFMLDTTPKRPKLTARSLTARYRRALTSKQYKVLLVATNTLTTIRPEEFFIRDEYQLAKAQQRKAEDLKEAKEGEPCVDLVLHSTNKALRAKTISGARRIQSKANAKSNEPKFQHKQFDYVPDELE